jgi:hypothetical protein
VLGGFFEQMGTRWTWDEHDHPLVLSVFDNSNSSLLWCDDLEDSASDITTGKVLCVCASLAITLQFYEQSNPQAHGPKAALTLVAEWIDDPTDELFESICNLIFADDAPNLGGNDAYWWCLRTVTSCPGCKEAAWALNGVCEAVLSEKLTLRDLLQLAKADILARRSNIPLA